MIYQEDSSQLTAVRPSLLQILTSALYSNSFPIHFFCLREQYRKWFSVTGPHLLIFTRKCSYPVQKIYLHINMHMLINQNLLGPRALYNLHIRGGCSSGDLAGHLIIGGLVVQSLLQSTCNVSNGCSQMHPLEQEQIRKHLHGKKSIDMNGWNRQVV